MKFTLTGILSVLMGSLLVLAPAYASAHGGDKGDKAKFWFDGRSSFAFNHDKDDDDDDDRDERKEKGNFRAFGVVTAVGSSFTLQSGEGKTYTVETDDAKIKGGDEDDISVSDVVFVAGRVDDGTIIAARITNLTELKKEWREKAAHTKTGIVTAVSGANFTLEPFNLDSAVAVATNGATVFKVGDKATTSSALSVGSRVLVTGTTTGSTFSASVVQVLKNGFGHAKHWFSVR